MVVLFQFQSLCNPEINPIKTSIIQYKPLC